MKYYYEYKEKNGCKIVGHNLEVIEFYDNKIRLYGIDIVNQCVGKRPWSILLDMNEIEYLKIEPMVEKEND